MNALIIETLEEKFPKTFVPGFSDEFMIAFIDKAISENRYDEATRAAMLKTKAEVLESMAKSKK